MRKRKSDMGVLEAIFTLGWGGFAFVIGLIAAISSGGS